MLLKERRPGLLKMKILEDRSQLKSLDMEIKIKLYSKIAIFIKKHISIKKVYVIRLLKSCVDMIAYLLKYVSIKSY